MGKDSQPKTDMEQSIADILKEGGVGDEKQIEEFEKLKMREMSDAEAELRFEGVTGNILKRGEHFKSWEQTQLFLSSSLFLFN